MILFHWTSFSTHKIVRLNYVFDRIIINRSLVERVIGDESNVSHYHVCIIPLMMFFYLSNSCVYTIIF